jgi:hypothetical protein
LYVSPTSKQQGELSLFEKEQMRCLNKVMVQIEMSGTPAALTTGTGVLEAAVATMRARRKVPV